MVTPTRLFLAALVLAAAPCGNAAADTRVIGFTTYLRDGPSVRFPPIDEALSDERVEVLSCKEGWCRVAYGDGVGYVSEGALVAREPSAAVGDKPTCFVNRIAGYHGGPDVTFCYPAPPSATR